MRAIGASAYSAPFLRILSASSVTDDLSKFGTFERNVYARPADQTLIVEHSVKGGLPQAYDLEGRRAQHDDPSPSCHCPEPSMIARRLRMEPKIEHAGWYREVRRHLTRRRLAI